MTSLDLISQDKTLPANNPILQMQDGILAQTKTTFDNYSQIGSQKGYRAEIQSVEELQSLFQLAKEQGRNIAFRGAGDSLHDQAQSRDIVACLKLPKRALHVTGKSCRGSAVHTWLDVCRAATQYGLIPGVMPSTSKATLGGTLSTNALSQFSPLVGKEDSGVEAFTLLMPDGTIRTVQHPSLNSSQENRELFRSVIGGMGSFGVVLDVKHRLLSLPFKGQAQVESRIRTCTSKEELLRQIIDKHLLYHPDEKSGKDAFWHGYKTMPAEHCGFWGVMTLRGEGFVAEKRYVEAKEPLDPFMVYSPRKLSNIISNWLTVLPWTARASWPFLFRTWKKRQKPYLNDLEDATFLMEGNRKSRNIAKTFGVKLTCLQQTFVIPVPYHSNPYLPSLQFTNKVIDICNEMGVDPSLIDILTLPKSDVVLSSTRDFGGVAFTMTFQRIGQKQVAKIAQFFHRISEACASVGGRVHLTKNVFARPEVLQDMYSEGFEEWRALKAKYDPNGILSNAFLDRITAF